MDLPSGKHTNSYWKWPFIVDLAITNGNFPLLCERLPEGKRNRHEATFQWRPCMATSRRQVDSRAFFSQLTWGNGTTHDFLNI